MMFFSIAFTLHRLNSMVLALLVENWTFIAIILSTTLLATLCPNSASPLRPSRQARVQLPLLTPWMPSEDSTNSPEVQRILSESRRNSTSDRKRSSLLPKMKANFVVNQNSRITVADGFRSMRNNSMLPRLNLKRVPGDNNVKRMTSQRFPGVTHRRVIRPEILRKLSPGGPQDPRGAAARDSPPSRSLAGHGGLLRSSMTPGRMLESGGHTLVRQKRLDPTTEAPFATGARKSRYPEDPGKTQNYYMPEGLGYRN